MQNLYDAWIEAKEDERKAVELRRDIEAQLVKQFGVLETDEGTRSFEKDGYQFKIVSRMTRKVDGDKLQEVAAEHGLSDHLSTLFSWKPEINMTAWKASDHSITEALSVAITTKPASPSFTITKEQ